MKFMEGALEFDFSSALSAEKLDDHKIFPPIEGMKFVDFLIEEKSMLILIEVKDPSQYKGSASDPI
ncbi:MAG: hypothetical protein FVQ80_19175, partial [Planctomycetes bacterium]|nr:hypothetical protein [Planctomycetota bacterium]